MIASLLDQTYQYNTMQFRDLKTQYTVLKDEMDKAILDVVASSAYVMGPKIKEMETAFADYVGVKHCIACNSGTDALLLALKAWDVKPGDAVFVPSFTFFASAEVIAMHVGLVLLEKIIVSKLSVFFDSVKFFQIWQISMRILH